MEMESNRDLNQAIRIIWRAKHLIRNLTHDNFNSEEEFEQYLIKSLELSEDDIDNFHIL